MQDRPALRLPKDALFLAPMAGVTDIAFRALCKDTGADFTVTEMISAKGVLLSPKEREEVGWLKAVSKGERAFVQIFGSDPIYMGEMAARISEGPYVGVDINMGCPAPKIVSGGDGSALLKNPELAVRVAQSVVEHSRLPVSVKMRLGWTQDAQVYLELGKGLAQAGVSMITLHARTREQMYAGKADWQAIGRLADAISIPVIGNGDVSDGKSARAMLTQTGCAGVMIGRAAMGNPFVFAEIRAYLNGEDYTPPSAKTRLDTALAQARALCGQKGEKLGVREMRKQMAWYTHGLRGSAAARVKLNLANSVDEFAEILGELCRENEENPIG